jgi:hypothetical protein
MKLANATKLNRKSGGADLRCASPSSNSAAFKPSPFAVAFRKGALQVPRLPRISYQGWWRRELHAVFLTENRTRCSLKRREQEIRVRSG